MNEDEKMQALATLLAIELGHLIVEVQKGHKGCTLALVQRMTGLPSVAVELIVDATWQDLTERSAYQIGVEDGVKGPAGLLAEILLKTPHARAAKEVDVKVEVVDESKAGLERADTKGELLQLPVAKKAVH